MHVTTFPSLSQPPVPDWPEAWQASGVSLIGWPKSNPRESPLFVYQKGVENKVFDIPHKNRLSRSQSNGHVSGEHRGVHGDKFLTSYFRGRKYLVFTRFGPMCPRCEDRCRDACAILFGHSLL